MFWGEEGRSILCRTCSASCLSIFTIFKTIYLLIYFFSRDSKSDMLFCCRRSSFIPHSRRDPFHTPSPSTRVRHVFFFRASVSVTCATVCFSRFLMDSRKKVIHKKYLIHLHLQFHFLRHWAREQCLILDLNVSAFLSTKVRLYSSNSYRIVSYCIVTNTQNQRQLLPNITEPSKPR